jgi:hypothetical protein
MTKEKEARQNMKCKYMKPVKGMTTFFEDTNR